MVGDTVGEFVGSDVTTLPTPMVGFVEGINDGDKLGYEDGTLSTCKSISPENAGSESRIKSVKTIMLVVK